MPAGQQKIYSMRELIALEDDPNRWIVPGVIPKCGRTIIYGKGKSYKSIVTFDLCVAVASGGLLLQQFPVNHFGPVLIVSTEGSIYDNRDRILGHLRLRNLDPEKVQLHFCQEPFQLDDIADVQRLRTELERLRPVLLVLDPLDSCFAGDENSAKETKALRRNINSVITDLDTSVVVIHHAKKSGKDNPEADLRGSSAWQGWADVIVLFEKAENQRVMSMAAPVDVISVKTQWVRNGAAGHVFSVIPMHDKIRGLVEFAYLEESGEQALHVYLKQLVYKIICDNPTPMSTSEVAAVAQASRDRVALALSTLTGAGLAVKDVPVPRPTGNGRFRQVLAWRVTKKLPLVDAAVQIIAYQRQLERADLDEIEITPR